MSDNMMPERDCVDVSMDGPDGVGRCNRTMPMNWDEEDVYACMLPREHEGMHRALPGTTVAGVHHGGAQWPEPEHSPWVRRNMRGEQGARARGVLA